VDGAELAAVCDVDRSKAETMAQETGVPVFIEYEAMVQR
jgi:predicted dehydrogenase